MSTGRHHGGGRSGTPGWVAAGVTLAVLLAGCGSAPGSGPDGASPAGPGVAAPGATSVAPPPPDGEVTDPVSRLPVPTAVRIPGIDVESELIDLGIADDGTLQTPQDYDLAGWFTGGGRPGGTGPTVVAGHVDSTDGPAVFYRLGDLDPGDTVELDLAGGGTARYEVTRTEQYPKNEFPTFAVFGATADDEVRLVTCTGDFDQARRSYLDNLVVYARRV